MTTISVIIPLYKCGEYLKECVSSIIDQNANIQFEVILVDDGSSDSSGHIADNLAEEYSNIRTYHKLNGGVSSARNMGIEKASGEYLLFIDGDDTIDENSFEIIQDALNNFADMIVFGMSFDYYLKDIIQRQELLSCKYSGMYSKDFILKNFKDLFYDNVLSSACNKIFKREIVEKYKLRFNEAMTLYEDYDFVLKYLEHMNTIYCIDRPLYHYRHNLDSPHVRVLELDILKLNQANLMDTVIQTMERSNHKGAYEVACNLYMDLLVSHLMNQNHTAEELEKILPDYIEECHFQKLLKEVSLSESNQSLYQDIQNKRFIYIEKQFEKRKKIAKKKQQIKKLLKIIKL